MAAVSRVNLADVLQRVKEVSRRGIVLSSDISRTERELLQNHGYLKDIIKGWYYLTRPTDETGASTAWYSCFWDFLAVYLEKRFGDKYCLSASSSLDIHLGVHVVPEQVIVIAGSGGKTSLDLPYKTSLLVYEDLNNIPEKVDQVDGLRIMPISLALCKVPLVFFQNRPVEAEIALKAITSVAELTREILAGKHISAAERIVGAYRHLGSEKSAEEIINALAAAGYSCEPKNPFIKHVPVLKNHSSVSPYASRIESRFKAFSQAVSKTFKNVKPHATGDLKTYLSAVKKVYENDAYHSLSIEGYEVTPELIHRIRTGAWDPEGNPSDTHEKNALAAKGYLESFRLVEQAITQIIKGEDAVEVVEGAYQKWYQALFSASVKAGILEAHHLAGFRHDAVFIRGSRHVPMRYAAVPDAMDAFWRCMRCEEEPVVRAVLGHFLFVFIHPYMDGNGRMARFLMNAMLASGRYSWTIIRVQKRREYMQSLEHAVVEGDIKPFARVIRDEMKVDWSK